APRAVGAGRAARVERTAAAVAKLVTECAAAADERDRRASIARTAALNAVLQRPPSADPVQDQLAQQEIRAHQRTVGPVALALDFKRWASSDEHAERIRAGLTGPAPMVSERDAKEVRERVIAKKNPQTVLDLFAVRQLRRFAAEADLARQGFAPAMSARPALRDGPGGLKVLDA